MLPSRYLQSLPTIERIWKTFALDGLSAVLKAKKRTDTPSKSLMKKRSTSYRFRLLRTPEGHARWILQLLADKMVELEYFSSISHEAIRQVLKNELQPWLKKQWCIPPEEFAEFVAPMEDVLDIYHHAKYAKNPVVCVDETSKQHIKEIRRPLPMVEGSPLRYDCEYQRNGVSKLFMIFAPLEGFRHVEVINTCTSVDFAHICGDLVDVHFRDAEKITLVCDNLNTHKPASLYKVSQ